MSARAACRLEALGFTKVYDYVAGRADWLARAMPTEGAQPPPPRVAALQRDDVETADLHERIADVLARVEASPYGFALVTSGGGVLLGRLRAQRWKATQLRRRSRSCNAGRGPSGQA